MDVKVKLKAERNAVFDIKFPNEIVSLSSNNDKKITDSKYGENYRRLEMNWGEELTLDVVIK